MFNQTFYTYGYTLKTKRQNLAIFAILYSHFWLLKPSKITSYLIEAGNGVTK
jgi:hypothetical protein